MLGVENDVSMTCRNLLKLTILCALTLLPHHAGADTPPSPSASASKEESSTTVSKPRPKRLSPRERAAARRAAREAAVQKKQDAHRSQWLARLAIREVEPWPEKDADDEHAA